jgi:hypothetical protein
VAVPKEDFHLVPTSIHKYKRAITKRVFSKTFGYKANQTIKTFSHIGRMGAELYPVNKRRNAQHQHRPKLLII